MEDNFYAMTRWAAEDVQSLRPEWTLDQCEDWLYTNEHRIQNRLVELGWDVIECLLPDKQSVSEISDERLDV